jgi:hypothetical protein
MSRLVNRPITVTLKPRELFTTSAPQEPATFTDGDYTHHITHIIDWWLESGAWWDDEPPRTVYRVLTADQGMYDIEFVGGQWFIYRVWD